MAKSRAQDAETPPEPAGTSWKFLVAYFGGIVLAAVGIVGAVSMTDGKGGGAAQTDNVTKPGSGTSPLPVGSPYSKPVEFDSNGFAELSGDATGWIISAKGPEEAILTRLGDGAMPIKFHMNREDDPPTACSPNGDTGIGIQEDGAGAKLFVYDTGTGQARRFPIRSIDTAPPAGINPSRNWTRSECRVLSSDRYLTLRWSGEFAIWDGNGTRVAGQPTDLAAPTFPWDTRTFGYRRTVALTPDSKTLVRQNADGFTMFDTATAREVIRTEPLSKIDPAPKYLLIGTAIRADGSQIAALVVFHAAPVPNPPDFAANQWLVVFDGKTGKRLHANKVTDSPMGSYAGLEQKPSISSVETRTTPLTWWGGKHVMMNDHVLSVETGKTVAKVAFDTAFGVGDTTKPGGTFPGRLRPVARPDDRFWGIELNRDRTRATVFALDPPANLTGGGSLRYLTLMSTGIREGGLK